MWLTRLAIARPLVIWMALAAIAVLGFVAYTRLPVDLNPRVEIPTLTVTTAYPGAGPADIESQISKPIEDALGAVSGLKNLYSSSQPDVSIISMDFEVGTNLDAAAADVRERLTSVRPRLPAGAEPSVVQKLDINAQPVLYLGVSSPDMELQQLRAYVQDTLRPQLARLPGVAAIQVIGGQPREVHVDGDGLKLAQAGLTLGDLVNAVRASGRDIPSGTLQQASSSTQVRVVSAYDTLDQIRETLVRPAVADQGAHGSSSAGSGLPVTVQDVASVRSGLATPSTLNRVDGVPGVSLVVSKGAASSSVTVANSVLHAIALARAPSGAKLRWVVLRNEAQMVQDALRDVDTSLLLGAALAMAVVLLFLRNLRGTVIVSLAIPACVVATFLVMYLASFTLNQMTLLALSLSVGILVDDSIVVLESITRHLQLGERPRAATLKGRAEIGFADVTTTLVDVVVFVPIAFTGGIVGAFFRQFGLCIAFATLFSLVISFTVTPMLAARWYRTGGAAHGERGAFGVMERSYLRLEQWYRRALHWSLRRRPLVLSGAALALGLAGILAATQLGFEFLPGSDLGQISVVLELRPGANLAATSALATRLDEIIRAQPEVDATVTTVGQVLGGFGSIPQQGEQYAQIELRLKQRASMVQRLLGTGVSRRLTTDQQIAAGLRRTLAPAAAAHGARLSVAAVRSVSGAPEPIDIELRGADLGQLTAFAERVRSLLARERGVLDPDVSVREGKPELRAVIDPVRAAQLGVPAAEAGELVHDAVDGDTSSVLHAGGKEIPIRVRMAGLQRRPAEDVGSVVVGADSSGVPITLPDIATIQQSVGPANIERENGERLVTVTANLAGGTPLGNLQQKLEPEINSLPHPGVRIYWGGEAETLADNLPPFATALLLAVALVYTVMASLFNNLATPFVIMFALPVALVGALLALVVTHDTLSLVSGIGIIMLVGLMGRNAILLLDYTRTLQRRGKSLAEAVEEGAVTRLRPVLMTTTATIAGMLPVALGLGRASELRAPMAVVVIGGLLVSTMATLIVIPVLYTLFEEAGRKLAIAAEEGEA